MEAKWILVSFLAYTLVLFVIAVITSRKATNASYFIGNKKSPWLAVAYGMIGASLSGVTFISVPGWVGDTQMSYLVMVMGYIAGYFVITSVLLPVYYKYNLTSIYTYLDKRFGFWSYKTGAFFFLVSRIIGASFRMYLVVGVLQLFVFDYYGIPFYASVLVFILLINLYTIKGGIRTIVWTDTLQTTFMLSSVGICVYLVSSYMGTSLADLTEIVRDSNYAQVFFWDFKNSRFFLKQFVGGMFMTIAMTGLDQDMMQKNLSIRTLKDSKKNMRTLAFVLLPVNLLFLFLGASLFIYANQKGIKLPEMTDELFPLIALKHLGPVAAVVFVIGLLSAAYSSADSALTSLTTSFSLDFLGIKKNDPGKKRKRVHAGMGIAVAVLILIFHHINDEAVISQLFKLAGYTYGPLLGLFAFGIFMKKRQLHDKWVPWIAVASPFLTFFINKILTQSIAGYQSGFELLLVNGLITFFGLLIIQRPFHFK